MTRSRTRLEEQKRDRLVETTNSLDSAAFFAKYGLSNAGDALSIACDQNGLLVVCGTAADLKTIQLEACFHLIEETSAEHYKSSAIKWSPSKKKAEMKLPDMKYILLLSSSDKSINPQIAGFVSFMITYEDNYEVVYVYEIHFAPPWQGKGLGKILMRTVETIGKNVGVEKIMLTVFRANQHATRWYQDLGYSKDEFSPEPKRLRNGSMKEVSYLILSKSLRPVMAAHIGFVIDTGS